MNLKLDSRDDFVLRNAVGGERFIVSYAAGFMLIRGKDRDRDFFLLADKTDAVALYDWLAEKLAR